MRNGKRKFILMLAAMLLACWCCATSNAQEEFDSAFNSSGLPWYDESTRGLDQSEAPSRSSSAVSDRNRIPPVKAKKKGQQKPKPNPAPAAPAAAAGTATSIGSTMVYVACIILAVFLAGVLVYFFLKVESDDGLDADGKNGKRKRKIRDHINHLPFEIEEQDGDFESFAEKSLREGDYSKATIYLFADMLVAMSEAGVVRLQRGKTNRQYLTEIFDHEEIWPFYRKVMTAFEDAFFGKHEIEKGRAEDCFAERHAFDAALEKIRQSKFAASQQVPVMPSPNVGMETV